MERRWRWPWRTFQRRYRRGSAIAELYRKRWTLETLFFRRLDLDGGIEHNPEAAQRSALALRLSLPTA
jgi:hypothetical protein